MKIYEPAQLVTILLDEFDIVRTSDNIGWIPDDGWEKENT